MEQVDQMDQMDQMDQQETVAPDSTAVRVALWRALHVQLDSPPYVLADEVGLRLVGPEDGWRDRQDMDPHGTRLFRASIVARARFIEDLVAEQAAQVEQAAQGGSGADTVNVGAGVGQYVLLGAGLDTFAQRRPEIASTLRVFEVDQPGPQEWKRRRLVELGFGVPEWLRLVPVDFESGESWWDRLTAAGFDTGRPAVVASTGVTMYLTRDAIMATVRQIAALAPGSTLAMTFMPPLESIDEELRPALEAAARGASAAGTPFVSFFSPEQMLELAREAGFREVRHVSAASLTERYFAGRTDGLHTSNGEEMLVACT